MVIKIKVEEIDGIPCLLLDGEIIKKTRLRPGDTVRVMTENDMILIASEELFTD